MKIRLVKDWLIRKLGGVPNYTLVYSNDRSITTHSNKIVTLEASAYINSCDYNKDVIISTLSKIISDSILDQKLYSYVETSANETITKIDSVHNAVKCTMRVGVTEIV